LIFELNFGFFEAQLFRFVHFESTALEVRRAHPWGIMVADDKRAKWKRWRDCIAQCWQKCLNLALVLWIVRVPLCALIVGFLLLYCTPQAQDLFTEFADHRGRIVLFLVLAFVWAATTHYTSRLLLDTDTRFRAYARTRGSDFLACVEKWVPRVFGLVPFGLVLIGSARSIWNLPDIEDAAKIAAVKSTLYVFRCARCDSRRGILRLYGEAPGLDGIRPRTAG